jgi:hypothetical protein
MGGSRIRGWSRLVAWGTCALLVLPVLVDLARSPRNRPFGYAAADTFYYLGVARTAIESGSLSTEGMHPTNGFHPLWQAATVALYGVCQLFGRADAALILTILASLACTALAVWLLAESFQLAAGGVPAAFAIVPIGVYAVIASYYWHVGPPNANGGLEGALPVYGTLYSFVNGMESGIALLAFALLARTFLRREADARLLSGIKCGAACSFLCLARLDHAAFVVTPVALWLLELAQTRQRQRFLLGAIAASVLPLLAYCGLNLLYVGLALPVSGLVKSHFPMPSLDQVSPAIELLRAPLKAMDPPILYRILPMVLCPIWALGYVAIATRLRVGDRGLAWTMRSFATRLDAFLVKMAPGVVLLSTYDLLFVSGVGHWYFPVSTLYVSLTTLSLLQALTRGIARAKLLPVLGFALLAPLVLLLFMRFEYKPSYHQAYARFYWETAPRVREKLGGKVPKLVEMDDGIVAYSLHVPSVSASGYLLDAEAMRAWKARRLFDVAYHRGFHVISSFYYAQHGTLQGASSVTAQQWAEHLLAEDLSQYTATVLYDDPTVSLVELTKRGG